MNDTETQFRDFYRISAKIVAKSAADRLDLQRILNSNTLVIPTPLRRISNGYIAFRSTKFRALQMQMVIGYYPFSLGTCGRQWRRDIMLMKVYCLFFCTKRLIVLCRYEYFCTFWKSCCADNYSSSPKFSHGTLLKWTAKLKETKRKERKGRKMENVEKLSGSYNITFP